MTTVEEYSKIDDFSNNFHDNNLDNEIKASSLSSIYSFKSSLGDSIYIHFTRNLTVEEKAVLDSIVASHNSNTKTVYNKAININLKSSKNNNTTYTREATFNYEGSNKMGTIKKILISGYMDENATDYSIKIFDKTHSNIICENTYTNTDETILEMTSFTNMPTSQSLIEIFVKKTGGNSSKNVYLNSLTFYF